MKNPSLRRIERTFHFCFKRQTLTQIAKVSQQLFCGLVPLVSIFAQRFLDDPLEFSRDFRTMSHERYWFTAENRDDHIHGGSGLERRLTRDHLVKHCAETPDIRTWIDCETARLFRRHVRRRSHHDSLFGLKQ